MNKIKEIIERVRPFLANYRLRFTQTKFYQNKKIFFPVSISVGLLFLVILIGLIFGGKKRTQVVKNTPSPTPTFSGTTNPDTTGEDALSQIEQRLNDLKNQITNLDAKQSRLQPPTLDFKIKF